MGYPAFCTRHSVHSVHLILSAFPGSYNIKVSSLRYHQRLLFTADHQPARKEQWLAHLGVWRRLTVTCCWSKWQTSGTSRTSCTWGTVRERCKIRWVKCSAACRRWHFLASSPAAVWCLRAPCLKLWLCSAHKLAKESLQVGASWSWCVGSEMTNHLSGHTSMLYLRRLANISSRERRWEHVKHPEGGFRY